MSLLSRSVDAVFRGSGAKSGLEIWCIENLQLVPIQKSSYGKFFSGSAYIVLHTILLKSGVPRHDVHYWLGSDATEVDSAIASDKALELDAALGSTTVQYREVQGQETEKFLSYFKPCIIPIEGVFSSESGCFDSKTYKIRLLTCKGEHVVNVKEVPFSRSSLNHNDVFILDTASKIFLFSGCHSSIQERAKALEVVQYIKENRHNGTCEVATIEDGKFVGDPDVGEFWSLFGGYAPIARDLPSTLLKQPKSANLFWITTQGKLSQMGSDSLNKEMLNTDKCYMLDSDTEIFVWMGRNTSITERKTFISAVEDILRFQNRSTGTNITFLSEGSETATFRSHFDCWPQAVEPKLYEEGREKVAALFKQQGYNVKELPEEDCEPFVDCSGILKVWRVNGNEVSLDPEAEEGKLFSGDCYIVLYTYPGSEKDDYLFFAWIGRNSIVEDRIDAISHMLAMADSMKGDPVLVIPLSYLLAKSRCIARALFVKAQVSEGKEPIQFFQIFQTLIILKGGTGSRYKKFVSEMGIADETYNASSAALFRVQGSSPNNMQAIQVDLVSTSLNSSYCYILHTGASVFTWAGNLSSTRDHNILDRMLDLINPTWQPISVREGSEPDGFWSALGGKSDYPREKETKAYIEYPHLFTSTCTEGDLKVKEIFNFTQDDLTTEDVLLLDCFSEIYVWIGQHANVKSKQHAFTLGMKFLETDILVEGLSLEIPIYVITEGNEPPFFTRFFAWDSSKARMHGNSFERKLAILKGQKQKIEVPLKSSWKAFCPGATPNNSRRNSACSKRVGRSISPASCISGSDSEASRSHCFSSPTPIVRNLFSGSPDHAYCYKNEASLDFPAEEITGGSLISTDSPPLVEKPNQSGPAQFDGTEMDENLNVFPYEQLKVTSNNPILGIDVTKREAYLSNEEFQEKFGMTRKAFYELPKWRQNKHKMSLHLF